MGMKHLVRLFLVVALFAGVVCADSIYIVPALPTEIEVTIGQQVDYEIYWQMDAATTIGGYDIEVSYDSAELDLIPDSGDQIPGLGHHLYPPDIYPPPVFDPLRAAYDPLVNDDGAGLLNVYVLFSTDVAIPGPANVLLARLSFEVIAVQLFDGLGDANMNANVGNYGIAVKVGEGEYIIAQFPGVDGADGC